MEVFQLIAEKANCSVVIVHHTRKPGADSKQAGDMHQARGASALVNAARVAFTLTTMTEEEAVVTYSLEPEKHKWYIRIDTAKGNLQAPDSKETWFKREGFTLPSGDKIGVLKRVDLKSLSEEHKREAAKIEKEEIGDLLYTRLQPGGEEAIYSLSKRLSEGDRYSHIFGVNANYKTITRKICKAIGESALVMGRKTFKIVEKGRRKILHIECYETVQDAVSESETDSFLS